MFSNEHGLMFEPGEWIVYSRPNRKSGVVIEAVYPVDGNAGHYKILMDNMETFIDYHYVFELDVLRDRQEKRMKRLLELGI